MTATYERAVESLRSVSRQMDAADLSASDLVMATVAVNAMEAELAHLRAIEEAARKALEAKPMDWSIGIDSTRIVLPIDVFDPLMDALDALDDALRAALGSEP